MRSILGPVQVAILRTLLHGANYGAAIARDVRLRTGRSVADAQIYVALRRLEARGLIDGHHPHRDLVNGKLRRRKRYALTYHGKLTFFDNYRR